jgi:catechol 2,3-dioxygenase-like lactoylglutathione lyase family enzyme
VPRRRVVIDHLTVGVSDLVRSRAFYIQALLPLGFREIGPWRDGVREIEFGLEEAGDFAISTAYATGAPRARHLRGRPTGTSGHLPRGGYRSGRT